MFVLAAVPALAQEARTVAAGKRTALGSFALYSPVECAASSTPESRVATQPANGKVEVVPERRTVSGPQCKPFQMQVQMIYYTPKAGFRGTDYVSVDFFYAPFIEAPRTTSRRQSYAITVQ
ncbi:MAG: hypothetical protein IOB85_06575 [Methylobacterium sp.]|nr:hypothetical protein [Methylobacterium sp.]MCA3651397.1 hypothetical protein [Methylobacterium sp.]MCA3657897.1 hypothetical protein [Methylobacterium sp.]MCA3662454.1 hypothetical protein [Methylobacterium sp.]MCA3680597.1 hypothetical protein [Methylobacterium sp.]